MLQNYTSDTNLTSVAQHKIGVTMLYTGEIKLAVRIYMRQVTQTQTKTTNEKGS